VHSLAIQLYPVLAAEKSKTPFFIAGGLLVAWALVLALVLGLRKPAFPGNLQGQRIVCAITIVLVLGAISTAVITAGPPSKSEAATSAAPAAPTPGAAGTPTHLMLAANPSGLLSYNTKQLATRAGAVTITMSNMSPVEHNVTVVEVRKELGATPTFKGGSRSITLNLKPGTYTFFCSVPGHRQAGMEGTLTVTP
jgi:plastocyanin